MSEIQEISGGLTGAGRRFGIVAARFNGRLVEGLLGGATDCLLRHGVALDAVTVARVPGAFEIPVALEELARRGGYDALVALGVVIRGETAHFEVICAAAARGIEEVARRHALPIGFGVLTCDNPEQAVARAGGKAGNKGWEAALAALEMADLLSRLRGAEG